MLFVFVISPFDFLNNKLIHFIFLNLIFKIKYFNYSIFSK